MPALCSARARFLSMPISPTDAMPNPISAAPDEESPKPNLDDPTQSYQSSEATEVVANQVKGIEPKAVEATAQPTSRRKPSVGPAAEPLESEAKTRAARSTTPLQKTDAERLP